MALQTAAMFKQNESTNNQQQLHEARCQPPATDCSRAPSAGYTTASAANQTNSSSSPSASSLAHSSSQLGGLTPQVASSPPLLSSRSPASEQQASLAAAAAAMATQERLALLLHQQQQRLQEHRSFEARASSLAPSTGSFEEPEEESLARRLALFRDLEDMERSRGPQAMDVTSHEVEDRSNFSAIKLDGGEQETALNLSVSKGREPQEQKQDLTQNLFQLYNQQNLHSQLERQQQQFHEVNSRLYEHLLASQMRAAAAVGATGQPKGVLQSALSPSGSTASSSAASPPPSSASLALLLQSPKNQPSFSNPNQQHHPCHQQSSTSSSHHSHSSSASSSSSSGAADSLTGYSPTNDRRRHHFYGTASSGSSNSSASASTNSQHSVEQISPAAAAVAAQRLHQHLLNFNCEPANWLLLNKQPQGQQDQLAQLHAQAPHETDMFLNSHHNKHHLHNKLIGNINSHSDQSHTLMMAGLSHQQHLGAAAAAVTAGKTHPMLQHELGPVHKTDADDLDRIRNFIEQFKARRGALGLTQKQAAQCFRAYTNDRYAFSDNFVGHFEGFQFRPQTAMTIADSLAEWLEFAETETRQGRQLNFMPGKVKETRKRKYEVIRIRDSAKRVLVEAFEKNRSPSTSELEQLSKRTNIPSRNIEIFFKNRRTSRQYHH